MHKDKELTQVEHPGFSPGGLATGWILLVIAANVVSRIPGDMSTVISILIPSFLFFVPVQNYVNRVNARRNPNGPTSKWSGGQCSNT